MTHDRDHRITPKHLDRAAIVYPRQSSQRQLECNTESTRIQLGLREKAISMGWKEPVVIEEDLGISATGFAERPGFQRMLTYLTMRSAGIILCVDASRLSRNSKDWAQLFELCPYFDTLIADLDQVYDLSVANDRLVLGIKGTVAELEVGIIRNRMRDAIVAKARRGELRYNLPPGYVHDESEIVFDPDHRVQTAMRTMFRKFQHVTSVRQLAMWYRDTGTLFPVKKQKKGGAETIWTIPTSKTLTKLLLHPIYAGAYPWGRRETVVEYVDGKLVKRVRAKIALEELAVCIPDHHAPYLSWTSLLANREKIFQNRPRWSMRQNRGAIREGLALLSGLLRCAHCGGRIFVTYKKTSALYYCDGGNEKGSSRCMSFGSHAIDQRISEELLRAVEPFAVKATLAAVELKKQQREQQLEDATLQLQTARYAADRAFDQFDLCDPKNRLVADNLEKRLNENLAEVSNAKQRLQALANIDDSLSDEDQQKLLALAQDFATVWNHPDSDPALKKNLIRCAIDDVIVKHEADLARLAVTIHWKGGFHTTVYVKKYRRNRDAQLDATLKDLVETLATQLPDTDIARILNMKTLTTHRGLRWTKDRVRNFRRHHRIAAGKQQRDPNTLTMNQAQTYLGIGHSGILALARAGAISKNQITEFAPWRVSRQELDSEHVQHMVRVLKATGRLPTGGSPENQLKLFDDQTKT